VAVYVCTYKRNEPLARVLRSLDAAATRASDRCDVGVVVVDDNPDGRAKSVVDSFVHEFSLGLHYRHAGSQNISRARNIGLEAASALGDFVAMTDDDIVVPEDWFTQHLDLQQRLGADATTGPLLLRFPAHAPSWIHDEPFDRLGLLDFEDDEKVPICATGNSMMRSTFIIENPDVRFDPELGVLGGEDMVFYRQAVARGLQCYFSTKVAVHEMEPDERSTYRFQLGRALWMGNTEFVTNHRAGTAGRLRLLLRGGRRCVRGLGHPIRRLVEGNGPQLRFSTAIVTEGIGLMLGVIGVRLEHHAID
jgi:succinoglycan biosynthesis protein ExoM